MISLNTSPDIISDPRRPAKNKCAIANSENFFNPAPFNIGEMDKVCTKCRAKLYCKETNNICCSDGKVKINGIIQCPQELKDLFIGDHLQSKHFMTYIRQFNNANAFASMGANVENFKGRGPYCY